MESLEPWTFETAPIGLLMLSCWERTHEPFDEDDITEEFRGLTAQGDYYVLQLEYFASHRRQGEHQVHGTPFVSWFARVFYADKQRPCIQRNGNHWGIDRAKKQVVLAAREILRSAQ